MNIVHESTIYKVKRVFQAAPRGPKVSVLDAIRQPRPTTRLGLVMKSVSACVARSPFRGISMSQPDGEFFFDDGYDEDLNSAGTAARRWFEPEPVAWTRALGKFQQDGRIRLNVPLRILEDDGALALVQKIPTPTHLIIPILACVCDELKTALCQPGPRYRHRSQLPETLSRVRVPGTNL